MIIKLSEKSKKCKWIMARHNDAKLQLTNLKPHAELNLVI